MYTIHVCYSSIYECTQLDFTLNMVLLSLFTYVNKILHNSFEKSLTCNTIFLIQKYFIHILTGMILRQFIC